MHQLLHTSNHAIGKLNLTFTQIILLVLMIMGGAVYGVSAQQQWQPTSGPKGAVIQKYFTAGESCYAITTGVLYKHTASGWQRLGNINVNNLFEFKGKLCGFGYSYADGGYQFVESSDGGQTFTSTKIDVDISINNVNVMISDGMLYSLDRTQLKILASGDGKVWNEIASATDDMFTFGSFAVNKGVIFATSGFATGLWYSKDQGKTFTQYAGFENLRGFLFESVGPYLIIQQNGSLYLTKDGGNTLSKMDMPEAIMGLSWDGSSIILRVGSEVRKLMVDDKGVPQGTIKLFGEVDTLAQLHSTTNGAYYLSKYSSIRHSSDKGATWANLPFTANAHTISQITKYNNSLYCSTSEGFYRSSNNGNDWVVYDWNFFEYIPSNSTSVEDRKPESSIRVTKFAEANGSLFGFVESGIGGTGTDNGSIIYTKNNGNGWQMVPNLFPYSFASDTKDMVAHGNSIFVCGSYIHSTHGNGPGRWAVGGIMRTDDGGKNWFRSSGGLPERDVPAPTTMLASTNKTVYAWTVVGMYKSTVNGLQWTASMNGLDALKDYPTQLIGHENTCYFIKGNGDVMTLKDDEDVWKSSALPIKGVRLYVSGGVLYAMKGSTTPIVYELTDIGWKDISSEFNFGHSITSFVRQDSTLVAGTTTASVWRKGGSQGTSSVNEETLGMLEVKPNPARDYAVVNLPSEVTFQYYSLINNLGVEVQRNSIEGRTAELQIPLSVLSSGVYSLKIYSTKGILNASIVVVR
jgi:photosystem II stability/assembly factor-like uncharacterized protein